MAPRRNIKFNHRNGHASGADGRRSSFSDISEGASEPASEKHPGTGSDIQSDVSVCLAHGKLS
jgi:phosphatidate cytidylyltransferase